MKPVYLADNINSTITISDQLNSHCENIAGRKRPPESRQLPIHLKPPENCCSLKLNFFSYEIEALNVFVSCSLLFPYCTNYQLKMFFDRMELTSCQERKWCDLQLNCKKQQKKHRSKTE